MVGWCSMGTFNDPWTSSSYGKPPFSWSSTQAPQLHRCNTLLVAMRTSRPKLPDSLGGKSYIKSPFLIGKPSINGPFSMAMLNNQRVYQISMIDVKIPIKFSYLWCINPECWWLNPWKNPHLWCLLIPMFHGLIPICHDKVKSPAFISFIAKSCRLIPFVSPSFCQEYEFSVSCASMREPSLRRTGGAMAARPGKPGETRWENEARARTRWGPGIFWADPMSVPKTIWEDLNMWIAFNCIVCVVFTNYNDPYLSLIPFDLLARYSWTSGYSWGPPHTKLQL